jgi:hypothetical protein
MYDEILRAVIDMAMLTNPYAQVVIGSMPPLNGIAMTGEGGPDSVHLDIGAEQTMNIVCNGKNVDQRAVIRALDKIHRFLTFRKDYPRGDDWQIYSITTIASPRLLGVEQNSQWLYGSSLLVKFYQKGLKA